MENRNSYFVAGLSFLIAIFTCVTFVLFMNSNKNNFDDEYFVHASSVPVGMRKNSPVYFLGVPAGIVKDVYFLDYNQSKVEIKLAMLDNLQISKDSIAQVNIQLIGGGATLNITRGSGVGFKPNEKKVLLVDNHLEDFGNKVLHITEKTELWLDKLNTLLGDDKNGLINASSQILNDENIKNLHNSLDNIQKFSADISKIDFNQTFLDIKQAANSFNMLSNELLEQSKNGAFDFKSMLSQSASELALSAKSLRRTLGSLDNALFRLEQNPYDFFFKETKEKK